MSFCKEALSYRDKGYSVIPIPPKQKKPPLVSWTRVQSKRATKRQITDWWKELPDANVGIVFGALSGLVVIDCDSEDAARKGEKSSLLLFALKRILKERKI